MTKDQLQQELKEKVKEGVKPSDLKKLKRSKSADDIPLPPKEPDNKYPYSTLISQQEKITELEKETTAKSDTISLLRKKIESLEQNPPSQLLSDQLKEKQKEIETLRQQSEDSAKQIEELRKEKEEVNQKLTQVTQELDNSLSARVESIKQYGIIYEKLKEVELKLIQTEDDAAEDIIGQDKEISNLRGQRQQFKLKINELERDLSLASRLAELRKAPLPGDETNWTYLKYALYSLLAVLFTLWLVKSFKNVKESPNYD